MIQYVCPVCGKTFVVINRGGYLYKTKKSPVKYYCGYNCFRRDNPDKEFKVSDLLHARHM